jgi:uncharacterized protein involved in outer membrane biogenesis
MNALVIVRRGLICLVAALAALIVMLALLAAAVDAGYFREPFIRFLAARSGRKIQVEGAIEARLFSLNPRVTAERVAIGNPPWMPAGATAEIGEIQLVIETPRFGRSFGIKKLVMQDATLHLARDSAGRANWQLIDPGKGASKAMPLVHGLSMPHAHVELHDERRHLQFDGTVSAQDVDAAQGRSALRIDGVGQLNGKPTTFDITGDSLAGVSHDTPYKFAFTESSGGSRVVGHGAVLRPFNFDVLDTTFEATGPDLKDLYYLTGVTLVNTGSYHLSGKLARRRSRTEFNDLAVTSGQSDMQGHVSIETSSGRPVLDGELNSRFLRLADLGPRAAGRSSDSDINPATGTRLLLSNAMLSPIALRRGDAAVTFRAVRVDIGKVPLHALTAKLTIDHGVLKLAPLLAGVLDGKLNAHVRLDARTDIPAAEVDIKITDLQLSELDHKTSGTAPVEGLLQARIAVTGQGSSVHQIAATATGTVSAVVPHGMIRTSLAELTGIDLKGLGLLLAKNAQETSIRCGVASFHAHQGTLTTQTLVLDTDPVLITGDGVVHLDSETLDLVIRGRPKSLRLLRLRSPLLVRGTMAHPSLDIQAAHSVLQAAEAVALGVVLTPPAAVLAFIDPGLAKDANCAALLASAGTGAPHNSAVNARP